MMAIRKSHFTFQLCLMIIKWFVYLYNGKNTVITHYQGVDRH